MKTQITKNTLKQEKREATSSLKNRINKGLDTQFGKAYRDALEKITYEVELDELHSYRRIYWKAFRRNDTSIMNSTIEALKFQFEL